MLNTDVKLVVGCHRSGTSLFTSILKHLGGNLPSNLMRPALSNVKGFNESWYCVQANEIILKRMGLEWDSIVPTPKSIESKSFIDSQKKNVLDAIRLGFPQNNELEGPLVIKDPRMCRTFPIWEKSLMEMRSNVKIFLAIRHPFEVIQSLGSRDGIHPDKACYIWIWNVFESLIFTKKSNPRVIIYDKLILNSQKYLTEVLGTIISEDVEKKIDRKLNHNKSARRLFPVDKEPFRTALDVYDNLYNSICPSKDLIVFCEKIRSHSLFVGNFEKRVYKRRYKGLTQNFSLNKKHNTNLKSATLSNSSSFKITYQKLKDKIRNFI